MREELTQPLTHRVPNPQHSKPNAMSVFLFKTDE